MSHASVFLRGDDAYVVSAAKDVAGIFREGDWHIKLTKPSRRELGEVVLSGLAAYRDNVPVTLYVRGVKQPPSQFLAFAGFKSWRAFERGTTYFMIERIDGRIRITPTVAASKGGYLHLPDRGVLCQASAEEIGGCLLGLSGAASSGEV